MAKQKRRMAIEMPDEFVEVLDIDSDMEKNMGYVHDGYVYIYRGKVKKELLPASVYKGADDKLIWTKIPEEEKEKYSIKRLIPISDDGIFENLENKANLKEVDHRLIESADDAFIPAINETDDPLKVLIKRILASMRVDIKPSKDIESKNEISNMKSNLGKVNSKLSIAYFMKWIRVLDLDVDVVVTFTNSDGERETISQKLD